MASTDELRTKTEEPEKTTEEVLLQKLLGDKPGIDDIFSTLYKIAPEARFEVIGRTTQQALSEDLDTLTKATRGFITEFTQWMSEINRWSETVGRASITSAYRTQERSKKIAEMIEKVVAIEGRVTYKNEEFGDLLKWVRSDNDMQAAGRFTRPRTWREFLAYPTLG
ncbi:hypothetical protein MMC25_005755 [Agyrium rufum]|nr:hypothetical protein [Agyrium rufum]